MTSVRKSYTLQNLLKIQNYYLLKSLEILTYITKQFQARNQKFFRAGEVSENKGTSINI